MTITPLSMHGQGKITLPAKWRRRYQTKLFIAIDKGDTLLIKPLLEQELVDDIDELKEALEESATGESKPLHSMDELFKKLKK